MQRWRSAASVSALATLLCLTGCGGHDRAAQVLSLKLPAGDRLQSLAVASPDTTVLMVYDPSDCLACGAPYGAWRGWARESPRRHVRLVLARKPSELEAKELRIARAELSGILDGLPSGLPTPSVVVIGAAGTVDSAFGRVQASQLANRWTLGIVTKPDSTRQEH